MKKIKIYPWTEEMIHALSGGDPVIEEQMKDWNKGMAKFEPMTIEDVDESDPDYQAYLKEQNKRNVIKKITNYNKQFDECS